MSQRTLKANKLCGSKQLQRFYWQLISDQPLEGPTNNRKKIFKLKIRFNELNGELSK